MSLHSHLLSQQPAFLVIEWVLIGENLPAAYCSGMMGKTQILFFLFIFGDLTLNGTLTPYFANTSKRLETNLV